MLELVRRFVAGAAAAVIACTLPLATATNISPGLAHDSCTNNGIVIQAFPAAGTLGPIVGILKGISNPTAYQVVLYVQDSGAVNWWIKPTPGSFTTVNAASQFSFYNWAPTPITDRLVHAFAFFVIPLGVSINDGEPEAQ